MSQYKLRTNTNTELWVIKLRRNTNTELGVNIIYVRTTTRTMSQYKLRKTPTQNYESI